MPCNCNDERRVTICIRCEKENTGALTQAFAIEFKVDLEYCEAHQNEYINERRCRGLCLECNASMGKHDRGCLNE